MPPRSEDVLKSKHQNNQGTEEKCVCGERQQYPHGLHESMSISILHLGRVETHYPPARLFRNAQGHGAHLPHIIKMHTRWHSPQCGLQQTEARKHP